MTPGSQLDQALRLAALVMKDGGAGGSGGAGPATGTPMTGADVYTPNAGRGTQKVSRKSRLNYDFSEDGR